MQICSSFLALAGERVLEKASGQLFNLHIHSPVLGQERTEYFKGLFRLFPEKGNFSTHLHWRDPEQDFAYTLSYKLAL